MRLEGEFMFSTIKVLEVAREAEAGRPAKRPRRRPRQQVIIESDSEDVDEVSDCSSSSFGDGISVVVPRRRLS